MSLWDTVCHCVISEILGSCSVHAAGRGGDWLQMRALLHTKCPYLIDACLTSANKLGAAAAGNALWLMLSLCEIVLIPLCESDACSCDLGESETKAKKKHHVDVTLSSARAAASAKLSSSPIVLDVSDKYVQAQTRCAHCCIKQIAAAISHICTAVSGVACPATICIPSDVDAILLEDDDYLSVCNHPFNTEAILYQSFPSCRSLIGCQAAV
jgi:hypothetical protein